MDNNIVYATVQSEPLPVDLGAGAYCGGRPPTACSIPATTQVVKATDLHPADLVSIGSHESLVWW